MKLIITGAAGFIGYHLAKRCLEQGFEVTAIDNLNAYYDIKLKEARLQQLKKYASFVFYEADIVNDEQVNKIFLKHKPQQVVHLAAQAGVRYSLLNPQLYIQSNLVGFANIIEACRQSEVDHLIYASTSSVYGANDSLPYQEGQATEQPLSLYAATKKANELMAHSYSHLYQLPTTGLRFFTVYGPWGRPDMAFFSFTQNILNNEPIKLFNYGNMQRDFTYIDDIVQAIMCILQKAPRTFSIPYNIYNIGYGKPVHLTDYVAALEQALNKTAIKELLPLQAGDVLATHADISQLKNDIGYKPTIHYEEGIKRFIDWYLSYYQ